MFSVLFKETLAPLLLRLALAAIFIYHGWQKIDGHGWGASWADDAWAEQQKIPDHVKEKVEPALIAEKRLLVQGSPAKDVVSEDFHKRLEHLPSETLSLISYEYAKSVSEKPAALSNNIAQLAVAWGELAGGIALALGLLSRVAALGLIVIQVGAVMTVTYEEGFSMAGGLGYEYNIAIIAMCAALVFWGGGRLSVDHLFRRRPKTA
jgi:uncharacterized membrane protein YphA (DoxX/SURF4 family)